MNLSQLFSFQGRAKRKEYWIISIVANLLPYLLQILAFQLANPIDPETGELNAAVMYGPLALFIPAFWVSMAVLVRRARDTGRSGWSALTMFIPLVNIYFWFVFGFAKSAEETTAPATEEAA